MEFRNFTPFPALAYQAIDQRDSSFHVVAVRQTLLILSDGSLTYPENQEPLVVEDEYFGEINRSSVRKESDLASFKPKCDVVVVATGFAPGNLPVPRFNVSLRITSTINPASHDHSASAANPTIVEKTLSVCGPRYWKKSGLFSNYHLTEPKPIQSLPIRYEYAYGGELKLEDDEGKKAAIQSGQDPSSVPPLHHSVVESNPVGLGYAHRDYLKALGPDQIPAPQIEDPQKPVTEFGVHYPAQGFGVITKAWLPRRQSAGTIDDAFIKSDRWLPDDFDFAYWNGAHPDLQVPYLKGDETIELTNLSSSGELCLTLPGHHPYILVRYDSGSMQPIPINLDTLLIDVEANKLVIVHRLVIPTNPKVRVLEARLITKREWDAAITATPLQQPKQQARTSVGTPKAVTA